MKTGSMAVLMTGILLLLVETQIPLSAAPLAWSPGPDLGITMSGSATVFSGGKNILTGGDAYEYYYYSLSYPISLAATNSSWTYLSPYDSLNIGGGAVLSDGNMVIYGGTDGTNAQDIVIDYSLSGDTTPALPSMNTSRAYLGYAPDRNGNAYAFGGLDANGNPLSSAERLTLGDNTPAWAYIASLPGPRYGFPAVFNRTNYIYIFGGYTDPVIGTETASVLRYSVSGNSWTNMAPMPVAVAGSAATLGPDGKYYVAGGTCGGVSTNLVQVYDPVANSWAISTPLPEGLSLSAMGVDSSNRLIVMGGADADGYDVSDVWRSQPFGVPDSAPVWIHFPATNAVYLGSYASSVSATGNPPPTYTLVSGPAGMQVDYYSGAITWSPQGLGQIGAIPVVIQASNYSGSTNLAFTINVPNPPPVLPSNLTVVAATESSVTLSWSPEDPAYGAVTYTVSLGYVYHSPRGSGGGIIYSQIASTTSTTITISGLAAGASKTYYIKAIGPGGSSGYAAIGAATLPAPAPANFRVTGLTSTTITLAWDAPTGGFPVASYEVLGWYNGYAAQYPLGVANIQGTSITITGISPGTAFLWGVSALDTAGNTSAYTYLPSLVVNPVPQSASLATVGPSTSGGFKFNVQTAQAQTTWVQATTNLADPSSWTTIATNPPTSSTYIFTDPQAGQFPARYYRVVTP
jgi:hypothetical protein